MIKTAQLRVYVPAERPPVVGLPAAANIVSRLEHHRLGMLGEPLDEDAFRAEWAGHEYRCPRTPRLRALEGVVAIGRTYRHAGLGLIPEAVTRAATEELVALRSRRPVPRSHIVTSAWHIPVRWFVPFTADERSLYVVRGSSRIRYRTGYRQAMQRLERAIEILGESRIPRSIVEEVEDVQRWLAPFAPDSMIELDYGTVADMFDDDELMLDESAGELWASLDALSIQDWDTAGRRYGVLVSRWAAPSAVMDSN